MSSESEAAPTGRGSPNFRLIAALLSLFVVLGIAAWLGVDAWLAAHERNLPAPTEIRGGTGTGLDPAVRHTPRPDDSSSKPNPSPVTNERPALRLPVTWAVAPASFPEKGIDAGLRSSRDEVVSPDLKCAFHREFVEVSGELKDGAYLWNSNEKLFFPTMGQPTLEVRGGTAHLKRAEPNGADAVIVYFVVPVRVSVKTSDEAEIPVTIRCEPAANSGKIAGFQLEVIVRHGVEVNACVPPAKLSFSRKREGVMVPTNLESGIKSSIGDRAPQPNELIELTIFGDVELRVNLVGGSPAAVMNTLRRVAGVLNDASGDQRLAAMHFRLKLRNWGGENVDFAPEADWLIPPGAGTSTPSLHVKVPPLARSSTILLEVMARPSSSLDLWREQIIAFAEVSLVEAQTGYEVDAKVLEYNWTVLVKVQDSDGNPRPDFAVSLRAMSRAGQGTRWMGANRLLRTNASGVAAFEGLPAATGTGVRVTPEIALPKTLNPNFQRDHWFDGINLETTMTLVVAAELAQPVVLKLDPVPPVETRAGMQISTPVPYVILPQPANGKLVTDIEAGRATDNAGRIATAVRSPGSYVALVMTQGGEVLVSFNHDGTTTTEVPIRVEAAREIKIRCIDGKSNPLDGAIVFTSALEPPLAWALAMGEQKNFIRYFRAQTTGKDGSCKFLCQPGNANPQSWLIYHKTVGLFKAESVSGDVEHGFELRGVSPLPRGSLVVRTSASARGEGKRFTACLTPIFCDARNELSGLFVYLGQTIDMDGDNVEFSNLPVGRYAVAIVQAGDNTPQAKGPKWSQVIQIGDHDQQAVTFPLP